MVKPHLVNHVALIDSTLAVNTTLESENYRSEELRLPREASYRRGDGKAKFKRAETFQGTIKNAFLAHLGGTEEQVFGSQHPNHCALEFGSVVFQFDTALKAKEAYEKLRAEKGELETSKKKKSQSPKYPPIEIETYTVNGKHYVAVPHTSLEPFLTKWLGLEGKDYKGIDKAIRDLGHLQRAEQTGTVDQVNVKQKGTPAVNEVSIRTKDAFDTSAHIDPARCTPSGILFTAVKRIDSEKGISGFNEGELKKAMDSMLPSDANNAKHAGADAAEEMSAKASRAITDKFAYNPQTQGWWTEGQVAVLFAKVFEGDGKVDVARVNQAMAEVHKIHLEKLLKLPADPARTEEQQRLIDARREALIAQAHDGSNPHLAASRLVLLEYYFEQAKQNAILLGRDNVQDLMVQVAIDRPGLLQANRGNKDFEARLGNINEAITKHIKAGGPERVNEFLRLASTKEVEEGTVFEKPQAAIYHHNFFTVSFSQSSLDEGRQRIVPQKAADVLKGGLGFFEEQLQVFLEQAEQCPELMEHLRGCYDVDAAADHSVLKEAILKAQLGRKTPEDIFMGVLEYKTLKDQVAGFLAELEGKSPEEHAKFVEHLKVLYGAAPEADQESLLSAITENKVVKGQTPSERFTFALGKFDQDTKSDLSTTYKDFISAQKGKSDDVVRDFPQVAYVEQKQPDEDRMLRVGTLLNKKFPISVGAIQKALTFANGAKDPSNGKTLQDRAFDSAADLFVRSLGYFLQAQPEFLRGRLQQEVTLLQDFMTEFVGLLQENKNNKEFLVEFEAALQSDRQHPLKNVLENFEKAMGKFYVEDFDHFYSRDVKKTLGVIENLREHAQKIGVETPADWEGIKHVPEAAVSPRGEEQQQGPRRGDVQFRKGSQAPDKKRSGFVSREERGGSAAVVSEEVDKFGRGPSGSFSRAQRPASSRVEGGGFLGGAGRGRGALSHQERAVQSQLGDRVKE